MTRKTPRDRNQLHRTAGELDPVRLPYYVATPARPGQGAGWYWVAAGQTVPQLLGANVYMAQAFLLRLLEREAA